MAGKSLETGRESPFRDDLEEFAACIRGERAPRFSYAHDRAVHHTLMDICGETDVAEEAV